MTAGQAVRGRRPRHSTSLSDWQLDELVALCDSGWRWRSLRCLYGLHEKTLQRLYRWRKGGDA